MSPPARPSLGEGRHRYLWHEPFAETGAPPGGAAPATAPAGSHPSWAHTGIVVNSDGQLVTFEGSTRELVTIDTRGRLVGSCPAGVTEAHSLTLVEHEGGEAIWVADPGFTMVRDPEGGWRPDFDTGGGAVVLLDLGGAELRRLDPPEHPAYVTSRYCPTSVAVDERRLGGSGDVFVADGYGAGVVHRYDARGCFVGSFDGGEGAGRFDCPHAVFIDRRRGEPELYVTDRGGARIQVFDLQGRFIRVVGEGFLNSPSAIARIGEHLLVAELFARLALLGSGDALVCYLGEDAQARERLGWPNAVESGTTVPAGDLLPGRFNSPHGIAIDRDGNVYVSEWLIGGRLIKLESN